MAYEKITKEEQLAISTIYKTYKNQERINYNKLDDFELVNEENIVGYSNKTFVCVESISKYHIQLEKEELLKLTRITIILN